MLGVGGIVATPMALTTATRLGSYEILGLLDAGGMGEVYRARDPALKREVAIKVLPSFVSQDRDRLHRFEQEAQAAAALSHPNTLAVYQFGVFEGAPVWFPSCSRAARSGNCCNTARCRFAKRLITAFRSRMDLAARRLQVYQDVAVPVPRCDPSRIWPSEFRSAPPATAKGLRPDKYIFPT
jgi:hypothetical protein